MSNTPLWFRRLLVGGVSTLTAGGLGLAGLLSSAGPAGATSSFSINQLAGPDRFATAVAVAQKAFPSGLPASSTVIIASGLDSNLPDALAASYLAGVDDAPILLTNATGVPSETTAELGTLAPKNIVIVGGTAAVSSAEQTTLGAGGANVTRLAGTSRFLTADAIDGASTKVGPMKTAIVADGDDNNLVDALGASPLADSGPYPLFLINGAAGTLSSTDLSIMKTDGITNAVIVGGTAAVGAQVATQLTGAGITATTEAGPDRSATSEALANDEIANYGFSKTYFNIASGAQANLVDALSGGPLGGGESPPAPTLITDSVSDAASAATFASANSATEASANLFGGSAAVDSTAEADIIAAAKSTPAAPTSLPSLVSASITGTALVGNNTGATPGSTVQYIFSQSVTGDTINNAGFHAYTSGDTEYSDGTAKVDTTNSDAVDVLYPDTALQTAAGAATLTLATVSGLGSAAGAAVTSATIGSNPAGSEPIGTAATTGLAVGTTTAPDLVSAVANGAANTTNMTAVNVTFNKAAFVQSATGGGFSLVLSDGTTSPCTGPNSGSTTASGGTIPGGNGTTTLTLVCANDGSTPTTPLTTANIARAIDTAGAVSTTSAAGGVTNPAEATSSPNTPVNPNVAPDLTAVALNLKVGASGTEDSVTYTFNGPVTVSNPSGFLAIEANAATMGGPAPATPLTEDTTDSTSTTLVFTTTDPGFANVVGASVAKGAVTSAVTGVTAMNDFNEKGVTNSTSSSVTPGAVTAPQLKSAALAPFTTAGGTSADGGLYTFSEPVSLSTVGGLHLYDNTGTMLTCTTAAVVTSTTTEVMCTAYNVGTSSSTTAATATQVSGATLGTVDAGAVKGTGSPDNTNNPEGASS